MAPVITLTTDFGTGDTYVASMKGAILSINPQATIVDICHSVGPQNILQAAFLISTAYPYFPEGTIHLVIIDPGVGSQRKSIILRTQSACFLAPNNGVLSYIVDQPEPTPARISPPGQCTIKRKHLGTGMEAVAITNDTFWRHPVSPTFHGRDIFAPVAAHLSLGKALNEFGENLQYIHTFPIPHPYQDAQGNLVGHILHIDNFGNLITDIKSNHLPPGQLTIELANRRIQGLSLFYSQREGLMALMGSSGYLEISLNKDSAAIYLGSRIGDEVKLTKR